MMYLKIEGDEFSKYLYKEIEVLTNHAIINIEEIQYDKESRVLSIKLKRFKILSDKSLLGIDFYKYGDNKIPCLLVIKNITKLTIENRVKEISNEIQVLIGIKIDEKKNEIIIISAEEEEGIVAYNLVADYSNIDLELKDI